MASKPPLGDFLTALPALLQAFSRRVVRAIGDLIRRVAAAVRSAVGAVTDALVGAARYVWRFYCRLELSVVESLVAVALLAWSLRLLALLIAPAVILALFRIWALSAIYVAVLGIAIWKFYSARSEDVAEAIKEQAPVRALLTRIMRASVRTVMVVTSIVSAVLLLSSSGPRLSVAFQAMRDRAQNPTTQDSAPPNQSDSSEQVATGATLRASTAPRQAAKASEAGSRAIAASGVTDTDPANAVSTQLEHAFAANRPSIEQTLLLTQVGTPTEIEAAARSASRTHDLAALATSIPRDRKGARPLNDKAKAMFANLGADQASSAYRPVVDVQKRAFALDPLDIEIACNLAIYALRAGDPDAAFRFVVYAMSLPRSAESAGRTADWSTIAAVYAAKGDHQGAANALFVTLAISTDIKRRCEVAVQATRKTYGQQLRQATEAMLARVREKQLSDDAACTLPISW